MGKGWTEACGWIGEGRTETCGRMERNYICVKILWIV